MAPRTPQAESNKLLWLLTIVFSEAVFQLAAPVEMIMEDLLK